MMRRHLAILPGLFVLGACGDPLSGIERVSGKSQPLLQETTVAAFPTPEEIENDTPILAGLWQRSNSATDKATDDGFTQAETGALASQTDTVSRSANLPLQPATTPPVSPAVAVADSPNAAGTAREIPVALTVDADGSPPRQRLFRRTSRAGNAGTARRTGPDARDVPVGTVLPFGEIARVCDARPRDMGRIVEKAARKGKGYALHDTAPDSAAPRTFYVTGFADNCPRQFTAALALFGTAAMHEKLRYGLPAAAYPYSETDEAYEKLKTRVCNVGRSKPCGDRVSRLEKTTVFVSVYENFSENARWADLLLHDGELKAIALKTP